MDLQTVQQEIKSRSGDDDISGTQSQLWVNLAIKQWAAEADWFEIIDMQSSQTTVAGTAEYTVPTDLAKIISVKVGTKSSTTEPLSTEYSFVTYFDKDITTVGPSYYVNPDTGKIGLITTPATSGLPIYIKYFKIPADITLATAVPPFPENYHELVVFFALKKYWETQDEFSKSNYYNTEWLNMLESMKTDLLKQSRSQNSRMRDYRELLYPNQPQIINSTER